MAEAAQHQSGGSTGKALQWVKAHPYVSASAVFVVGAVLIWLYYRGGSHQAAAAQGTDPNASLAAQVQASLQNEAVNASLAAQTTQSNNQLALGSAQINGQVQLGTLQSNNDLAAYLDKDKTTLALATVDATTQQKGIDAQKAIQLAGITAQTDLAKISAGENVAIAGVNASTVQSQINANAVTLAAGLNAQNFQAWNNTYRDLNMTWLNNQAAKK